MLFIFATQNYYTAITDTENTLETQKGVFFVGGPSDVISSSSKVTIFKWAYVSDK